VVIVNDFGKPFLRMRNGTNKDSEQWQVMVPWKNPVMTISDNYYPISQLDTIVINKPKVTKLDTVIVKYVIRDPSGNTSDTGYLKVWIIDDKAPVIDLIGDPFVQLMRWHDYDDPLYSVKDNFDKNVQVTIGGTYVNSQLPGSYVITYQAKDHSGNVSEMKLRFIQVLENTGIEDAAALENGIEVFPVPASHLLHVRTKGSFGIGTSFELRDVLGKSRYTAVSSNAGADFQADVSGLPAGIYILSISDRGYTITRSVLIAH
jgi:hypothetical protein